jgi:flagellar export protein FliJ
VGKFKFKLAKVLEYRELEESWAKDYYVACQKKRMEAEDAVDEIEAERMRLVARGAKSLQDRKDLETLLQKCGDGERAAMLLLVQLTEDEDQARDTWMAKRKDRLTLQKIHDKALEDWKLEQERREQKALDEWATQRRRAS